MISPLPKMLSTTIGLMDMQPYIQAGKPVFAAEYTDLPGDFDEVLPAIAGARFQHYP